MSTPLSRAQLLRQHHRHEEAVSLLIAHLATYPDDAVAHLELALNRLEIPGQKAQALADARRATGLMPGEPFPLALQSNILSQLDREKEALPLAESAIALDPENVDSWNAKTIALVGLHRWNDAEASARQARELDPDDETASNLMAHVLRLQKKLDESEQESRRRLARDPDNAFSFANAGWAALQRHQVKEAENFFKEALRLNPEMKYAREGLKESYRARSGFYRLFLRWAFFQQRFSEQHRTLIVIGIIFGFRIIRFIAQSIHPLLVLPVFLIYYLFLFGSWLASGIANCLVMKDPVARMSLDRGEKVEGVVVGLFFFAGIGLLVGGGVAGNMAIAIAGGTLLAAALPASLVFTNESRKGAVLFLGAALAVLGLGASGAWEIHQLGLHSWDKAFEVPATGFAFLIAMLSTWLAMVPSLRQVKPS